MKLVMHKNCSKFLVQEMYKLQQCDAIKYMELQLEVLGIWQLEVLECSLVRIWKVVILAVLARICCRTASAMPWVSSSWVTNSSSSAQAHLILLHILNHLPAALLLVMMVVMVVVMMPVIFHVVLSPAHDCRCIWCSSGGLRNYYY
jgi:hypothetical protein